MIIKKIFNYFGYDIVTLKEKAQYNPLFSHYYHRHTRRRLEHLTSLGLDITGKKVFEVGAGAGDHTDYFVDRGCRVVTSDAREENLQLLRLRYPGIKTFKIDLEDPPEKFTDTFDVVYCYGVLYHLRNPSLAIKFLSEHCSKTLLLSTCVAYGNESMVYPALEKPECSLHSISGRGCRPTRQWIYDELKKYFTHVYMPLTQPNHAEFPLDWSLPPSEPLPTVVYIASRDKIDNASLEEGVPEKQIRH